MTPSDTIRLQALKLKQLNTQGHSFPDALLEKLLQDNPDAKKEFRNICALISPKLFADVEELAALLSLSKRSIIEMALIDFIDKAKSLIDEIDPLAEVGKITGAIPSTDA